jgi:DNA modification methylase
MVLGDPGGMNTSQRQGREIVRGLQVRLVAIEKLIPNSRNARTHSAAQVAQVAASIQEFGWTNPILIRPDCRVIAGHARLLAARQLGLAKVPVIELNGLSEAQCRALAIADNQLALNAGWDVETLQLELEELRADDFDLDVLGFGAQELDELWADLDESSGGLTDEDAVPQPPERAVTLRGDLWLLGRHRLLCGDATVRSDVDGLISPQQADLLFTDPPYNVDYEGYTEDHLKIAGDRMSAEQFRAFLSSAFASYRLVLKPKASLYVCHPSLWQIEFQQALEAAGFEIRCQIIWAKNTFAWGFGRYKFQHEPIFYAHVKGHSDPWYGDQAQSTLWQENKPAANRLHPTMKPVELIERAIANSSCQDNLVVDLFGGSGSTLMACERTRRMARLMEIDPRYCDVIVRRWQEFTGKEAVLDGANRSFNDVARERFHLAAGDGALPSGW